MTITNPDQFLLGGGGGKSAKFEAIGATITGTITTPPKVAQQTDMKTGAPLTWDNGDPREQLVVSLQTTLREDQDDDGIRNLYVKGSKKPESQSLHAAVAGAVQAAGAKGLEVGGTLTVQYVADGVPTSIGLNPPKKYVASYQRPTGGSFLGTDQPAAPAPVAQVPAPVAAPVAAPAAAPAAGQPTPEQVAALRSAGIDPATVYPGYVG